MSRWIDADALQSKAYKMNFDQRITERELALINYIIQTMPKDSSIDIVRCKECKYSELDCCQLHKRFIKSDDFCSYGERRE